MNIFDNPQFFREEILSQKGLVEYDRTRHNGKSLICVFFTSYCGVGCPFCFFSSPSPTRGENIENKFNKEGVDKFIQFANSANVGYLQISGGGEPFLEKEAILKSIEKIKADRIILVTSGIWAYDLKKAEKYLGDLEKALRDRNTPTRLSIRLSVSEDHSLKLKNNPIHNLLQLFETKYKTNKDFTLQLKTFDNDMALQRYLEQYHKGYNIEYVGPNCSDDEKIVKIMPKQFRIVFESGYSVVVGKSRVFTSNLRPDLSNQKAIENTIDVYNKDTQQSQSDYPAVVFNSDGKRGIDWIVEYNGNVCTWQNRVQDNLLNIYEDDYSNVYSKTISDPLTLSFIEKGASYREKIINEVAPHSVTLMKAVSIRDYAGTLLFEDEKTRLYYTLRVLQDYIKENRVNAKVLECLSDQVRYALNLSPKELMALYKKSTHSILRQEVGKPHNAQSFRDFLELVKLGHYNLSEEEIRQAIEHYNSISNQGITDINQISHPVGIDVERRFTKRVMTMKKLKQTKSNTNSTEKHIYIYRHGETIWNAAGMVKGQMDDAGVTFTDRGLKQINDIAKSMSVNKIEIIYASDLERAKNTAILANTKLNKPMSFHSELRGLNMGIYQGMSFKDFINAPAVKRAFECYDVQIPGGESINQLNARTFAFLQKIVLESTFENIAIVMHSAAMSNLKAFIAKEKYEDIESCELLFKNNKFSVIKTRQKTY